MAENLYATPSQLATELDVDEGSLYSLLEAYLEMASRMIDDYCGRSFFAETGIVEKIDGKGRKIMFVSKTPITAITSIVFDGTTIASSEYEIWEADSGSIYRDDTWDNAGSNEGKRHTVTYNAGYVLPGASGRTLPYAIEYATLHIARYIFNNRNRDANITEEEFPSVYKVKYTTSLALKTDALTQVEAMIYPYKFVKV